MKTLLAQLNPIVGDLEGNQKKVLEAIAKAKEEKAELVVTPELALCGYPPEDFLLMPHFIQACEAALEPIIAASKGVAVVVGLVRAHAEGRSGRVHNSAAVIEDGKLLGFQDKILLPTYDVFDEQRYFEPAAGSRVWEIAGKRIAVTICEDIWHHAGVLKFSNYAHDPVMELVDRDVDLVVNLSSSPYHRNKLAVRLEVARKASRTIGAPLVMVNQVGGNDSLLFDGRSTVVSEAGVLTLGKRFEEECFVWSSEEKTAIAVPPEGSAELYQALVMGVRDYFSKQGFKKACLGLSGGIDSALVAAIATDALGAENVRAIAMPSRYSSEGSRTDADRLAENLGIQLDYISIEEPFTSYLDLMEPFFEGKATDTTEENLQARIRGMILMALSNKHGYIVLSTGNKSEMAMGYSTLYGDLAGGLAVISDLTKQQVYALCRFLNKEKERVPPSIIDKPPSAELRPNQKDSDSLPDYSIIDAVLKGYIEEHRSPEEIASEHGFPLDLVVDLVQKIHRNEYKRRQAPPGLRVTEKAFSIGRRFPIVQRWVR